MITVEKIGQLVEQSKIQDGQAKVLVKMIEAVATTTLAEIIFSIEVDHAEYQHDFSVRHLEYREIKVCLLPAGISFSAERQHQDCNLQTCYERFGHPSSWRDLYDDEEMLLIEHVSVILRTPQQFAEIIKRNIEAIVAADQAKTAEKQRLLSIAKQYENISILRSAIEDAIATIVATRPSFKSEVLADLRARLETVLGGIKT